jgi:hypothetical protein
MSKRGMFLSLTFRVGYVRQEETNPLPRSREDQTGAQAHLANNCILTKL